MFADTLVGRIFGAINWLFRKLRDVYFQILVFFAGIISWGIETGWSFAEWVPDFIYGLYVAKMKPVIDPWVNFVSEAPWEQFYVYWDTISWYLPVYAAVHVFIGAYLAKYTIVGIRTLVGWIPTIDW